MEVDFSTDPPKDGIRLMALSPLLIGLFTATVVIVTGLWDYITNQIPYYLEGVLILSWIVYSHLSPTDIRTAYRPYRNDPL